MNNFVNFLLDYYPYILGVLGIIIITIIGYLADSKKKREKKLNNTDNIEKTEIKEEVKTTESTIENSIPTTATVNEVPKNNTTEQINNAVSTLTNEVVNTPVNNIQNNIPVNNAIPQQVNSVEQVPNVVNTIPVTQVVQPNIAQSNISTMPQQSVAQSMYNQNVKPVQVMQPVVPQPVNAVNLSQMVNGQTTYYNQGYAMPQPIPNQQVVNTPVTPIPNVVSSPATTPVNNAQIAGLNFVTGKTPETEKDEEMWKL